MQDRPNARELIEAVAGFLDRELVPTLLDPRLRFRALIAINVLGIVARELELGNSTLAAEWQRLATLLHRPAIDRPVSDVDLIASIDAMRRELRDQIRRGELDGEDRFAAALAYAEASVVDKLKVSSPRFLARLGVPE